MNLKRDLLKRRPLIAAASAGILVAAFAIALSVLTWRAEYARQASYLETLANMGERSLDTFFVQLRSAMAFLGEEVGEHGELDTPQAARRRLIEFRDRFPALSVVALVRADGQIIATTWAHPDATLPTLAREDDFVQTLREFDSGQDFTITRPLMGRITKQWQISPRWAIRDARGQLTHFLAGALPLTNTQGFWAGSPVPEGVILGVVRDDGYLLVRHPTPSNVSVDALYRERRSGALIAILEARKFPKSGLVEGDSSSTGEPNLIAFRRFANFPLTFRVSIPYARLRDTWWATIFPIYALTFALLGALVAVYRWQVRLQRTLAAERDRQLAALETSNRELTRANDELDGFSYTVAHDLRAPVRALDSFAGLLGEAHGKDLGDDGNALLKRIRDAAARMEALIDGILAFARLSREKLNLRDVDTATLVAAVAAEVMPASPNYQLVVGALPTSHADPVMLRVVWFNLLANAVKYSRHKNPPRIEVGHADGEFFVRDNGAGFDMAHAHHLFGAFQRLHAPAEFEGTGIGLAIVKRVVERHGGKVRAFGRVGEGAEFRFSLGEQPLAQTSTSSAAAPAS